MPKQENKILYQSFPKKMIISQVSFALLSGNKTLVLSLFWVIIFSKIYTTKKSLIPKEIVFIFTLFFIFIVSLFESIFFLLEMSLSSLGSIDLLIPFLIILVIIFAYPIIYIPILLVITLIRFFIKIQYL